MSAAEGTVMSTTPVPTAPAPKALPPITGHDRCERCGAQAYVRTQHAPIEGRQVEMFWCAHHFGANAVALLPLVVIDDRNQIT